MIDIKEQPTPYAMEKIQRALEDLNDHTVMRDCVLGAASPSSAFDATLAFIYFTHPHISIPISILIQLCLGGSLVPVILSSSKRGEEREKLNLLLQALTKIKDDSLVTDTPATMAEKTIAEINASLSSNLITEEAPQLKALVRELNETFGSLEIGRAHV